VSGVSDYYHHAELALVAYATLEPGAIPEELLRAEGMDAEQARRFASQWVVAAPPINSTTTGLSATVFQRVTTGERHLAIQMPSSTPAALSFLCRLGEPQLASLLPN